jgi:hypothetical protein
MSAAPPGSAAEAAVLPWEIRPSRDPAGALVESAKLFATNPDEAWRITPERGGLERPLLYGLIVSFVGAVFAFVYRWIFVSPFSRMFSHPAFRRFGWMMGGRPRGCSVVVFPITAAITAVLGLFIVAAVLHLFVLLVGGARSSTSGFEGTFRVVGYASTASVAQVIPFIGGLIAIVWWIYIAAKGIQRMHRTTSGRALAAILLPMAAVAVCIFIAMIAVLGLLFAAGHRGSTL